MIYYLEGNSKMTSHKFFLSSSRSEGEAGLSAAATVLLVRLLSSLSALTRLSWSPMVKLTSSSSSVSLLQ